MPLFSGSGAVKIMDLYEDEPNDDYESYAMRQRMQAASWRPIDDDNTGDDESPTWI